MLKTTKVVLCGSLWDRLNMWQFPAPKLKRISVWCDWCRLLSLGVVHVGAVWNGAVLQSRRPWSRLPSLHLTVHTHWVSHQALSQNYDLCPSLPRMCASMLILLCLNWNRMFQVVFRNHSGLTKRHIASYNWNHGFHPVTNQLLPLANIKRSVLW